MYFCLKQENLGHLVWAELINGREKAEFTGVQLCFHLKKNGYRIRRVTSHRHERIETMFSDLLVRMFCAPESRADWQRRYMRLTAETSVGRRGAGRLKALGSFEMQKAS